MIAQYAHVPFDAERFETLQQRLTEAARQHEKIVFASSLSAEDMVILHAIAQLQINIQPFVINTGRLHQQTLDLLEQARAQYGIAINVYEPAADAVNEYVVSNGADAFFQSVELRKQCCDIRKVQPLRKALSGQEAWITGQRREQAVTRSELALSEFDNAFGLQKYNPLADWSRADVWATVRELNIPYNLLHDQFYPSIGCEPCTRAVAVGEDERAGRWWWENPQAKECGLHAINIKVVPLQQSSANQ